MEHIQPEQSKPPVTSISLESVRVDVDMWKRGEVYQDQQHLDEMIALVGNMLTIDELEGSLTEDQRVMLEELVRSLQEKKTLNLTHRAKELNEWIQHNSGLIDELTEVNSEILARVMIQEGRVVPVNASEERIDVKWL